MDAMSSVIHTPASRPRLRPGLAAQPDGDRFVVHDPLRIAGPPVVVTRVALQLLHHFDGRNSLSDLANGVLPADPPTAALIALADALETGRFLDGPNFRSFLTQPVRPMICAGGVYPVEPGPFRAAVHRLFAGPHGPGLPKPGTNTNPLRGVLVPHMDFGRGNVTYGFGFKELVERTDADLFFVVATSHYSPARFTLTRMDFAAPLGIVETDRRCVDRVAELYGPAVYDDPVAHFPEHSIELEIVVLQALREGRPFRIVPLLVGSFADCVQTGTDPADIPDIARMVEALRRVEAEAGEKVCYLISGDLAHIGPKFGDPDPVAETMLTDSRIGDELLLKAIEAADPEAYFRAVHAEQDRRRICGFPPTWLTLAAAKPRAGKRLHYQQFVAPDGHESVSFAAAAFDT
jgi:AmmeMemoRadiSam system protein B